MPDPRSPTFVDLVWLLEMSHDDYLDRFRGTAVRRAKHWMLQRNAAVALGNTAGEEALPALGRSLQRNPHPVVRGHAAWAVGQIGARSAGARAMNILRQALAAESASEVRQEIEAAMADVAAARVLRR